MPQNDYRYRVPLVLEIAEMSEAEIIIQRLNKLIAFYEKLAHAGHYGRDVARAIKKAISDTSK